MEIDIDADDVALLTLEERRFSVTYRLRPYCAGKRCRVITGVMIVLLIVIGVVVLGVVFGNKNRSAKSNLTKALTEPAPTSEVPQKSWMTLKQWTTSTPTAPPIICNTSACHNISQDISRQLNKAVNPCDDFYSYTCGGFFKRHQLGENQSMETAFSILNDDNTRVIRHTLQNGTSTYPQSLSIRKTTQIYNSCVNTTAINNRGIAPLVSLIEKYGGWTVTGKGLNSWTVQEKMGHIQGDLNVQTLLSVSVRTDFVDSARNILMISPSVLGMSASYYDKYTVDPEILKIQRAYKKYMKTIAGLLGGGSDAKQKMMRIYNFERDIANLATGKAFSYDMVESLEQYYHSRRSLGSSLDKTIREFCSDSTFELSFILGFLDTAFSNQGITFNSWESVFYGSSSIFSDIALTYQTTSQDIIKDYIMWRVVSRYVSSMPDVFVQAELEFVKTVAGAREYQRWSVCIEQMMTPMDMTLGRMYVDAHFDEATKTTVQEMTTLIRKAFISNLDSADWMDNRTKKAAKEKANAIKEDVGYPLYIKNDTKLDEHYSMLTVDDNYFENTVAMNKMLVQKNFGMLRHPVNNDLWGMGPAQINGYYNPQQNRIVFLAGILQSPFYKKNTPKYLNYGSLATVIGHEITHGFDNRGRLFDKNGNVKDWWSYYSSSNFKYRSKCLVNQYGDYKVFGKYIDGQQTLGENIADNGGIKLAYEAYQSWVRSNGRENPLPDLSMSVDQLFFIGFAMTQCSVYKKKAALYQLKRDVHSYPKYRVIGSLSNFKKFAKAFNCPSGSEMNPVNKCSVW